jgi:hypothetical protein
MDCGRIDLIGYHFGVTDDAVRDEAEKHLLSCAACLGAYLALKRHLDGPGDGRLRPSDEARARLRAEVGRRFGAPRGVRALLTRPIPLYQGLAAAALILLCTTVAPELGRRTAPRRVFAENPPVAVSDSVDTARTIAESVGIY